MAVVQFVIFLGAATALASSKVHATVESGKCYARAGVLASSTENSCSKGVSLMQIESKIKRDVLPQSASSMQRSRSSGQANTSNITHSRDRPTVAGRNLSLVLNSSSSQGPSLVYATAAGNVTSIVHSNASGSGPSTVLEAGLQKRFDDLAQSGAAFSSSVIDFIQQVVHDREVLASSGWFVGATLLTLVAVSCLAACLFISRRPDSSVRERSVYLRGTQSQAAMSGKGVAAGKYCTSAGQSRPAQACSARGSNLAPETAALATTWGPPSPRLLPGDGRLSAVPSTTHTARSGPTHSSLMVSDAIDSDPYFCRDLVVPVGCECVLKVPLRCLSKGPIQVTDLNEGSEVLRIEPHALQHVGGGSEGRVKLVLTTEFSVIVGQCMPSPSRIAGQSREEKQRECALVRASGDIFAVITKEEGMEEDERQRYTLTTKLHGRLYFWGSKHEQTLNVMDSAGKLVAMMDTHRHGSMAGQQLQTPHADEVYFKLRVAPLMDVGLILGGLLCIQHLM